MAGIDGIKNKIHPGDAMDKDLYELLKANLKVFPQFQQVLENLSNSLDNDRDFLKAGDVFTDNLIDAYISLKMDEVFNSNIHRIPSNLKCIIQFRFYLIYFFEKYLNNSCLESLTSSKINISVLVRCILRRSFRLTLNCGLSIFLDPKPSLTIKAT